MQCSQCGTQNDEGSKFCMHCGSALVSQNIPTVQKPANEVPESYQPTQTYQQSPQPSSLAQPVPQTQTPTFQQQNSPATPVPQQWSQPSNDYKFGTSSLSAVNLWGPFAGYGTRRRHIGWLMDNRGEHAQELIDKIQGSFYQRDIKNASIQQKNLVARGVVVENRPYFLIQKRLVTMGLYIGNFGRDLFISLVSYLKPPISYFRVIVLTVMVLFWLYSIFILPGAIGNTINGFVSGLGGGIFGGPAPSAVGLLNLLCLIGPLSLLNSILLFLFVIYSIYKWFKEKDILGGLRVTPNEFNEDDLMALEKAVEQTVRISLDEIGLDPQDLKPITSDLDNRRII